MRTLLSLTLLMSLGGQVPLDTTPAPQWQGRFAGKSGWVGGDVVASAPLSANRIVWLFGDTLVGQVKDGGRPGAVMINNSVALQTGQGKDQQWRFVFGKPKDGKPTAFITPMDGKGWFWPQSAVRVRDKLYVFLPQIDRTAEPGVFAFRPIGQWLASVYNPDDEPEQWRIRQHRLPFAEFKPKQERSWGSATLVYQDHLYVFGYFEEGKALDRRRLTVARVPLDQVEDFAAWRFRGKNGWGEAKDALPLATGLATEFSVCRVPAGKGFVLVYTENGIGDRVVGRFADTPAGPWSDAVLLYRCPERKDAGVFTYAAKAHGWASTDDTLLVSYCTNAWNFDRLFRDEQVYRPKFIRVKLGPRS